VADVEKIQKILFDVIDELNKEDTFAGHAIAKSSTTLLFGKGGGLDSLGLVNMITKIEQKIEDEMGVSISLADERALSQTNSPFQSVQTLSKYIETLIDG
jgi:acyl carrier protein